MLGNKDAVANLAVKNLETARKFYEGTLGLHPEHREWMKRACLAIAD
jgi:catechol 2,3-dioxygenase-like lactoylglutathione lyase family enzyme